MTTQPLNRPVDVVLTTERPSLADMHRSRADWMSKNCKPSARKSFGSYKPVIVIEPGPWQRTEVVGVRAETRYRVWIDGKPDVRTQYTHYERGRTFDQRADAVSYAQRVIERRVADAIATADKCDSRAALANIGSAA